MRYVYHAYGEYLVGPSEKMFLLPDHVSFEEATLVDTLSVCLHAQHRSGLTINDKVAILGAGPIGLGMLMLAKASGADVLITDIVDKSLDLAKELGADMAANPHRDEPEKLAMEWTDGRGCDIVFECAGGPSMPQTLPQATKMVRRGGKIGTARDRPRGEVRNRLPIIAKTTPIGKNRPIASAWPDTAPPPPTPPYRPRSAA